MIEDINERKRVGETIANERALLRAVVDAVPERIYVKDREGRFLLQNAANVRAHGAASHEELLGKTVYDIFPHDVAQRVDAEDRGIIESGTPLIDRERTSTDSRWQQDLGWRVQDSAAGCGGQRSWHRRRQSRYHSAQARGAGTEGERGAVSAARQQYSAGILDDRSSTRSD